MTLRKARGNAPSTDPPRRLIVALVLLGLIFLCTPRVVGWQALYVHKEDGVVFLSEWTRFGWETIFSPYSGYLHFVPRVLAAMAAQFPPEIFPMVVTALAAAWRIWLATLAYWVFRSRDIGWKASITLASTFVLVPAGEYEALGNLTNLRWFGNAAAVVLALGHLRGARMWGAAVTMAACALTDPLVLTLLPIFGLILWLRRGRHWEVIALGTLGCLVQWFAMDSGERSSFVASWLSAPLDLVSQLLVRGGLASQFGISGTQAAAQTLGYPAVLVLAALPIAVLALARSSLTWLLVVAALFLLAGTISFAAPQDISVKPWWGVAQPSRYSVTPAILLSIAGILAVRSRLNPPLVGVPKFVATLSACVLGIAIVADFRGDPIGVAGQEWSRSVSQAQALCRDLQVEEVVIQMTPQNSAKWRAPVSCNWLTE